MIKETHMSGGNSVGGSKCGDKPPKVNLLQHVNAHDSFSMQNKFLSSNFLYSLPTQKRNSEVSARARLMACRVLNLQRVQTTQADKAWQVLSSGQFSCRNYVKPGKTVPVVKDINDKSSQNVRKTTQQSPSYKQNNIPGCMQIHKNSSGTNAKLNEPAKCTGSSLPFHPSNVAETGKVARGQNEGYTPTCNRFHAQATNGIFRNRIVSTSQAKGSGGTSPDCIDDDDILENIDVDQIVMEHYQSTCTPQPSISKLPPVTPTVDKNNFVRDEETCLPSELCLSCNHGFMLGLCPEASNHLQDMKDKLIALSNELLDNVADLSSNEIEKLRQERLQLNKQVQQLEKYLRSTSVDEERQKSQFSASTAPSRAFQYETPPTSAFRIDSMRSNAQSHIVNGAVGYDGWNSSSFSLSSVDRFGASSFPVEREQYVPKNVEVNYIEGSNDKKWSSQDFPWTNKLEDNNKKVFGNHSFRPNQREVINATMSGHDVFVLMPTGGGKSLTYQLPALICPGITLVISPLVSLIQDQIMHLLQANIPAAYLSANMEWTEQQEILRELSSDYCKYKLLYVTPEKVAKSDVLLRHLDSTYARESLARIVIDEAHCVSQWGHDFRPDYQGLGILKQKFPNTPVLGLTATATASVKEDVVQALGLVNCIVFRQSFNRPNLCYSVIPKTKKCVEDIDGFIKKNHFDECGIIYCLSRMDCEKVAEKLQECGHKAAFYHGSMDPAQRAFIQKQWSKDEINIICATVAFGMGINKPDVRFVIHHSLPKSIEGYHQECGRAGRDGQHSSCVLYYSYSDYIRVQHMITQGAVEQSPLPSGYKSTNMASSGRILETNTENLRKMVNYCENDVECRRILQLIHFGERFNPSNCKRTCDNCSKNRSFIEKDVTETAKQLVEVVKLTGQQFSSSHILEVYRGSLSQFVKKHKHNTLKLHGAGKHLTKSEASRILHHLVVADFLVEDVKKSDIYGSLSSILKVNESKACLLWSGGQKITLRFPSSDNASKLSKSGVPPAKGSLISGRQSPPQMEIPSQPQSEVDSILSAKLYSALRKLRTGLLKESDNQGLTAYHIFGNATLQAISRKIPRTKEELLDVHGIGNVKLTKYGDRVLETIEATIKEHNMAEKNSSGSNGSSDSVKRRRDAARVSSGDSKDDGDFMESTGRSKKRTLTKPIKTPKFVGFREADSYNEYVDVDPDCYGSDLDMENSVSKATVDNNDGGRVLPSWSMPLP
ncbi:ATP-dependent DNA helicase Q-like 4A isoform X2 [Actinidia eriantha]|uniref:ATP-dependent DNA helicase Q-like 4A isoform X2 n=1 Tax=Actinidia eriantha TaxID=165200 RepID=UPI00258FAFED|nr:ATP-dependent DNA helicase Q-like 4A isoform X2 [Actinidia eriantha]